MQGTYTGGQMMVGALVIVALAVIAACIMTGCWRSVRYAVPELSSWRNVLLADGKRAIVRWLRLDWSPEILTLSSDVLDLKDANADVNDRIDRLVERTRRDESIINDLNRRLTKAESEHSRLFGRVVALDEACEGEKALRTDLNGLSRKVDLLQARVEGDWKSADAALIRLNQLLLNERSDRHHLAGRVDAISDGVSSLSSQVQRLEERKLNSAHLDTNMVAWMTEVNRWMDAAVELEGLPGKVTWWIDHTTKGLSSLEEGARLDLADIRTLKAKVNHIIPEVLT